jgi:predicted alpha-1,2-mannosidase
MSWTTEKGLYAMRRQRILLVSLTLGVITALTFGLAGIVTHSTSHARAASLNLTQYVNPFIGTTNSGDTFPGADYPTGMVQWSPDTTSNPPGGYYYGDNTIKNFSLTNFSGRGCSDEQDIPFMPYVGAVNTSPATSPSTYYSTFAHSSESASPGYYKVHLDGPNVTTELTATARTGQGQFTYQPSSQSTMLINPGGSINGNTSNTGFTIVGNNEVTGYDTSTVGCGGNHYTLYFAAYFDHTFTSEGTWNGSTVNHGSTSSTGAQSGAYVTFGTNNVQVLHVRVGISYVSLANAQANLTAESPSFNFSGTQSAASTAWNTLLNTIQVAGGTTNETTAFYTALYHSLIHPNIFDDSNGQYLGFDNKVHTVASGHHQYENISSWDLYRSLIRLRAIITPSETADIAQSLVNDAQQGDGHLPRWEQKNADSFGMNGDGADVEIADAYAYGDTGFDTAGALTAMVNGQAITRGSSSLNDYVNKGYVTQQDAGNSAVATQEYTNDDFALAEFAKALGNTTDYTTYLQRSNNWVNLFDSGAGGYIFPKNSDGSYASTSITSGTGFQETDSSQSTWMESFDLASLFSKIGGNAAVVSRLDTFFTKLNDGTNSQYAYMGNEPNEEAPWAMTGPARHRTPPASPAASRRSFSPTPPAAFPATTMVARHLPGWSLRIWASTLTFRVWPVSSLAARFSQR